MTAVMQRRRVAIAKVHCAQGCCRSIGPVGPLLVSFVKCWYAPCHVPFAAYFQTKHLLVLQDMHVLESTMQSATMCSCGCITRE
jgi:hypothetical protein